MVTVACAEEIVRKMIVSPKLSVPVGAVKKDGAAAPITWAMNCSAEMPNFVIPCKSKL